MAITQPSKMIEIVSVQYPKVKELFSNTQVDMVLYCLYYIPRNLEKYIDKRYVEPVPNHPHFVYYAETINHPMFEGFRLVDGSFLSKRAIATQINNIAVEDQVQAYMLHNFTPPNPGALNKI